MKKSYVITYLFKQSANLRPQAVQTLTTELTYGSQIKEAFELLYNLYGDDIHSIMSVDCLN